MGHHHVVPLIQLQAAAPVAIACRAVTSLERNVNVARIPQNEQPEILLAHAALFRNQRLPLGLELGGVHPGPDAEPVQVQGWVIGHRHVIVGAVKLQGMGAHLAGHGVVDRFAGVQRGHVGPGGRIGNDAAVGGPGLIKGQHQHRRGAQVERVNLGGGEGAVENAHIVQFALKEQAAHPTYVHLDGGVRLLAGEGGGGVDFCPVDVHPVGRAIEGGGHVVPGILGQDFARGERVPASAVAKAGVDSGALVHP